VNPVITFSQIEAEIRYRPSPIKNSQRSLCSDPGALHSSFIYCLIGGCEGSRWLSADPVRGQTCAYVSAQLIPWQIELMIGSCFGSLPMEILPRHVIGKMTTGKAMLWQPPFGFHDILYWLCTACARPTRLITVTISNSASGPAHCLCCIFFSSVNQLLWQVFFASSSLGRTILGHPDILLLYTSLQDAILLESTIPPSRWDFCCCRLEINN